MAGSAEVDGGDPMSLTGPLLLCSRWVRCGAVRFGALQAGTAWPAADAACGPHAEAHVRPMRSLRFNPCMAHLLLLMHAPSMSDPWASPRCRYDADPRRGFSGSLAGFMAFDAPLSGEQVATLFSKVRRACALGVRSACTVCLHRRCGSAGMIQNRGSCSTGIHAGSHAQRACQLLPLLASQEAWHHHVGSAHACTPVLHPAHWCGRLTA